MAVVMTTWEIHGEGDPNSSRCVVNSWEDHGESIMGLGELQTSGRGTKMGNHRKPRLWSLQIHSTRGSVSKGLAAPTRDSTVKTQGESLTSPLPWCHHVFLNENKHVHNCSYEVCPPNWQGTNGKIFIVGYHHDTTIFFRFPEFPFVVVCLPCSLSERAVSLEIRRTSTISGSVPHLMVGPPWLFPPNPQKP